jgi:outer membrane usher protein
VAIALAFAGVVAQAGAADAGPAQPTLDELSAMAAPASDAPQEQELFLEVFFGQRSTGLIASVRLKDERLYAKPAELREIGLALPAGTPVSDRGLVGLDDLPGLTYEYDRPNQRLVLAVPASLRPNQHLGYAAPGPVQVNRDTGLLLGYDVYAQQYQGKYDASLATSLRWFGRAGTLELSGISRAGTQSSGYERLDSRWTYSDPDRLWTWTAGDLINGGLSWTRPVRMGGLQWRRNFGVRPDLVTLPIPRFSSSAVVPSSVDLYINNVKQLGAEVQDGPFVIDSLPRINGAGEATLVVRDASGRVSYTTLPLYVDNRRLARGLSDFSLEAGKLRVGYGDDGDRYASDLAASGSWRRGVTDTFTLETHGEATSGLRLGGVGGAWAPGNRWGLVTAAYARSAGASNGNQRTLGYQWNGARYGMELQWQRRSAGYRDLGSRVVAHHDREVPDPLFPGGGGVPIHSPDYSIVAQDRATVWMPVRQGNVAFTWLRWQDSEQTRSLTRSLSWSQSIGSRLSLSMSAYDDEQSGRGISVVLSLPLGERLSASANSEHANGRTTAVASLRQDAPYEGGWGWQVIAGDRGGAYAQGSATVRGRYGDAWFGAESYRGQVNRFLQGGGSVVVMDGQVLPSRRISDSFALVSTSGVADIPILSENRTYGRTNARGYLLLPDMRGWQRNRVAINPDELGADYRLGVLEQFATPADQAGALVRFEMQHVHPLRVVLRGPDGGFVPAGSRGTLDTGARVLVGFDGEAYLDDVAGTSSIRIDTKDGPWLCTLPATASKPAEPVPLSCRSNTP